MRKQIAAAAAIAATAWAVTTPASAVDFKVGLTGGIRVSPDFSACATVDSGSPYEVLVGSFSAVGEMQGPGTRVGTVRYSVPFVATRSWSACMPGAYVGATAGEAKYLLHAHTSTGELAEVLHCVVNRGVLTCV